MPENDKGNILTEGLKELRAAVESKNAESGETKEKVAKIEKELGDIVEAQQKALAVEKAKSDAVQAEVDILKEQYTELYKQKSRKGFGASEDAAKEMHVKYASELDTYLRKGLNPTTESLDEVAFDLVSKNLVTRDEKELEKHKSIVTGNGPDGGLLIFPDRRTDITVDRIFETSPVRSVAKVITTTSSEVEVPISDQEFTSGGWVGEVASRSSTANSQFGMLTIATHEQYAMPKVSQKMLDDTSMNIEQLVSDGINDILVRTENTAFVTGDGAAKPKGFMSYAAWTTAGTYERNKIEQINSGTSAVIKADSLIDMANSLIGAYQANAVWMMKRDTWGSVLKLKDGNGAYLMNVEMMSEGATMRLQGKPVIFADDMAAIAADSLSIAYGDFNKGYTIVDRLGIRVLRDAFTDKPFTLFYTTKRVGGAVTSYEAIKIYKLAA